MFTLFSVSYIAFLMVMLTIIIVLTLIVLKCILKADNDDLVPQIIKTVSKNNMYKYSTKKIHKIYSL